MGNGQKIKNRRLVRLLFLFAVHCLLSTVICAQPAQAGLIRDAEIEHTLRLYADPVFRASGLKPSAVDIYIVGDDALNAYVAGGANLFLYTGIILATDTPDMLIGVIAHESGHIAGGHLARGSENLKGAQLGSILTFVLGAAAGVATGKPEATAAVITGGQNTMLRGFLSFTRANEEAADQSALNALDKLGISASGMLKTFQLLQRNERLHMGSPDPYLLTHPLSASRIEHVRNHMDESKIPEGQYPPAFTELHQRMVAKLFAFIKSPEQTLQKYPQSDDSVAGRMARTIAYYKMPDLKRSLAEMDALMAERKNDPFLYDLKGQILFENGKTAEALAAYTTANRLLPGNALILTELGKVEIAQDDPKHTASATQHLEKATSFDRHNPESWRLLGTAYGKAGNKGKSMLALAEEALLVGDAKRAREQAQQAETQLAKGSAAWQRSEDVKAQAAEMEKRQKDEE